MPGTAFIRPVYNNAINTRAVLFKLIEGEVVLDEEEDHEGGADADRESEDIDERKGLVPPEGAERDAEIVFKHTAVMITSSVTKVMP